MRTGGLRLSTHSGVLFPRVTESLLPSAGLHRWRYHPQDLGRKGLACKTSLLTAVHKIFLKLLEDEFDLTVSNFILLGIGLGQYSTNNPTPPRKLAARAPVPIRRLPASIRRLRPSLLLHLKCSWKESCELWQVRFWGLAGRGDHLSFFFF